MKQRLRGLPVFQTFSDASLEALVPHVAEQTLEEGEVLFREGDAGEALYVLETGQVEIRKKDKVLAVLQGGHMLGEMALFEKETRSASAVAAKPTIVFRIGNEEFLAFLLEHAEAGAKFLFRAGQEMSRRLRSTSEYLTTVFETGKIASAGLDLQELTRRILERLLDDVEEATGGTILLWNPFAESYEIASQVNPRLLDLDGAVGLVGRHGSESLFQDKAGGAVLGVAVRNERGDVLGYILLEKEESDAPFSTQQEIVVAAVGQQTGLGILHAYSRKEDEARERLARQRMRGF